MIMFWSGVHSKYDLYVSQFDYPWHFCILELKQKYINGKKECLSSYSSVEISFMEHVFFASRDIYISFLVSDLLDLLTYIKGVCKTRGVKVDET